MASKEEPQAYHWPDTIPNPGSNAALFAGCLCARGTINNRGRWEPEDGWHIDPFCPLHTAPKDDGSPPPRRAAH